jgi:Family of unknown function (DUF6186)
MVRGGPVIDRHVTLVVWAALGAAVVVTQLVAAVSGGRVLGVGSLVERAGSRRVARLGLVIAWMWLGWHAFAR